MHTSTAQLRYLQAQHRQSPHSALTKWETQLNCTITPSIWSGIWLNFRSASENTFLWQLLYRAIATQRWRFPRQHHTDATTWCTRCTQGTQEDVFHCIWACPISIQCWKWGESILQAAAVDPLDRITLTPAHVFVAQALPTQWHCPERLWQILKGVLCWQIWKNHNEHYMAEQPADPHRVIRKAWHRLGTYLQKEWRYLLRQVEQGKLNSIEAEQSMYTHFGSGPAIWNLHGITLQVPPVPRA